MSKATTNGKMTPEMIQDAMRARGKMLSDLAQRDRELLAQLEDVRAQMAALGGSAAIRGYGPQKGSAVSRVLEILHEHGPLRPREIIKHFGPMPAGQLMHPVYSALQRLRTAGRVTQRQGGEYVAA